VTESFLSISAVNHSFGSVQALRNVSLEIGENEFFALLGPSGCGKTTLLRTIAGFEVPDSGSITLDGVDLLALPPHRRPVNLMFQSYALFPHLSVRKNVAFGLEREHLSAAEINTRVSEVLEIVGLTDLAHRRPAKLSGGQRQRVALARAIVKRPRVLLLDEPLSALDRKIRAEMQLELKRMQHELGITFVMVTHDQGEALSMADRIAVFASGEVQQVDTPQALYQQPANLFVADFIGVSNALPGQSRDGEFHSDLFGAVPATVPSGVTGPSHLVIRPEAIQLKPAGAGPIHGRVAEVEFQGASSTVALDVEGLDHPMVAKVAVENMPQRNDVVTISWQADRALAVLGSRSHVAQPVAELISDEDA
jgi:spermidine/putrescine transport system ATP-binding protein/putrescine transport system ATP-binding protein